MGSRPRRILADAGFFREAEWRTLREGNQHQEVLVTSGRAGLEVYRGKGRHARRVQAASGSVFLRLFMAWLRRRG